MAITLKGIRLESLNVIRDKESGVMKLSSASYALISSSDKVLANQSIGDYGQMNIAATADTLKILDQFIQSYKKDITTTLGLEES